MCINIKTYENLNKKMELLVSTPKKLNKFGWVERDILKEVLNLMNLPHIRDTIGVRRAGKTFLMYRIISHLNFDDPEFKSKEINYIPLWKRLLHLKEF